MHFLHAKGVKTIGFLLQADEMAQLFMRRIAQAEAMAHEDMLRYQIEVLIHDKYSCELSTNLLTCYSAMCSCRANNLLD